MGNIISKKLKRIAKNRYVYDEANILGHGAFGVVFEGKCRIDNTKVAIKRITFYAQEDRDEAHKELQFMTCSNHENVMGLKEAASEGQYLYIIMNLCKGNLDEMLNNWGGKFQNARQIHAAVFQISSGYEALYRANILHRDIKPQNILYTINGLNQVTLKIADLGCGKILETHYATTALGTLRYMAPEVLKLLHTGEGHYDARADVWSMGLVFCQAATGTLPVTSELPPKLPMSLPTEFIELCCMMVISQDQRMQPKEIFLNQYVRGGCGIPIELVMSNNAESWTLLEKTDTSHGAHMAIMEKIKEINLNQNCKEHDEILIELRMVLQDHYQSFSTEDIHLCVKIIEKIMTIRQDSLSAQTAGSGCFHYICERTQQIHPSFIGLIVTACLTAVETYNKDVQLNLYVWSTLSNESVLVSKSFDILRCCTAALESMIILHNDMIVLWTSFIVANLYRKMKKPNDLSIKLDVDNRYIKFLIQLLIENLQNPADIAKNSAQHVPVSEQSLDIVTCQSALAILVSFTDESPYVCENFIKENGLQVVMKILEIYRNNSDIETSILTLLSNLAEVPNAKIYQQLNHSYLSTIRRLSESKKLEISYTATGILARIWERIPAEFLNRLARTVSTWKQPEKEFVTFRTLMSFRPIITANQPSIQLFGVWSIRHLCILKPGVYVDMVKTEIGRQLLEKVRSQCTSSWPSPLISAICDDIFKLIA